MRLEYCSLTSTARCGPGPSLSSAGSARRSAAVPGSKAVSQPSMRKRSWCAAAATIASACSASSAKGFSTRTWKPASRAAIVWEACREFGEPM